MVAHEPPGLRDEVTKMWGIYDTQDSMWIGDEAGPRAFEDHTLAQCAAQITEEALLGTDLACRFQAREIPESAWRLRDELALKHSPLEAIRRIEGR